MFFQNSVLKKHLNGQDAETVKAAYQKFTAYFHNPAIQQNIREAKEEQFQEGFLRELFVNILGYTLNPQPNFNLTTELKNEKGAKKCDGAILAPREHSPKGYAPRGHVPLTLAVIELKGTDTKDLDKINVQAFNYKNNQSDCVYVITSNFEKLRFFIHHSVEHIDFNLFTLSETEFQVLWLCLSSDNLLGGVPLKVKEESLLEEEKITKHLYKDYAAFRNDMWQNMVKNNAEGDKLLLFKKTQKLLDRYLFIFFAEDSGLLPPNSISRIVKRWEVLKEEDAYKPLYDIFKQYFGYIDTGRKGKKSPDDIFAYNGGLFQPDEVLDTILLDDEMLHPHVIKLTNYDFQSEVDVNILGHIFENSLNEIESITAQLEGQEIDKSKSKRKKDGVFYTPKYITKYIVDNTVGKLCGEKKAELEIIDEEYAKGRKNRNKDTLKKLDENLQTYRNWLLNITICDPACGSGAFLNQALEFLMVEHAFIDELETQLLGNAFEFPEVENHILEKNIYGVDINNESVDIARLSLWLRTAQRGRKLTSLNNNIKCGNSLIDDPKVAGEKAFNWQKEFPTVFHEKDKKAYHITTATHDSRTSQRMIDHKVRLLRDNGKRPKAEGIWLEEEDEIKIAQTVATIIEEDKLNVMAFNICGDHLHLLLVCNEEEVTKIVGKIKAITAKIHNREKGITVKVQEEISTSKRGDASLSTSKEGTASLSSTTIGPVSVSSSTTTRGHVPLAKEKEENEKNPSPEEQQEQTSSNKKPYVSLWTQKFGCKEITTDEQLWNTVAYIQNNRNKHELNISKEMRLILANNAFNQPYEHAFRQEYDGGFDVVIGNPPYVRSRELFSEEEKNYYLKTFETISYQIDLYKLFIEKSCFLINNKGKLSFITPSVFLTNDYDKPLRQFILDNYSLEIIATSNSDIFDDASVKTVIFLISQFKPKNVVTLFKIDKAHFHSEKTIQQSTFIEQGYLINEKINNTAIPIINRMNKFSRIGDFFEIKNGIKVRKELLYNKNEGELFKPFILGKNVQFYQNSYDNIFIDYKTENEKLYTNQAFRTPDIFEQDKLITRQILGKRIISCFDNQKLYTDQTTYVINKKVDKHHLKYLLCLLNSKLIYFLLSKYFF